LRDLLAEEGGLRPRDVVDVLEAQELELSNGRPLTRDEWTKIWARDRRWNGDFNNGPRRRFFTIQAQLLELTGHEITWASPDGRLELHFAVPELVQLMAPYRERAYALSEKDALREQKCRSLYQHRSFRISDLKRKFKTSAQKVTQELKAMRVTMRPARRARVEEDRDEETVKAALEEFDAGAPVSYVAWILRCSRPTARAFLERHGRSPPRAEPPGVPGRPDPRSCALLATFV